ncbi:MAG: cyclic pyranopterin monophosphate synthase MoaC, partial [Nostocales cyanobacterium]
MTQDIFSNSLNSSQLSHITPQGEAQMVDVSGK